MDLDEHTYIIIAESVNQQQLIAGCFGHAGLHWLLYTTVYKTEFCMQLTKTYETEDCTQLTKACVAKTSCNQLLVIDTCYIYAHQDLFARCHEVQWQWASTILLQFESEVKDTLGMIIFFCVNHEHFICKYFAFVYRRNWVINYPNTQLCMCTWHLNIKHSSVCTVYGYGWQFQIQCKWYNFTIIVQYIVRHNYCTTYIIVVHENQSSMKGLL